MSARQLPAVDYAGLKTATRQLRKSIGTQAEAAAATRVGQQTIAGYESTGQAHDADFAPIDVIADLEAECGQPLVTRKLAELSGHVLVPLPVASKGGKLGRVTAAALKETAEVFAHLGAALEDERICGAEAETLGQDIDDAIAKLAALKLQIVAEVAP